MTDTKNKTRYELATDRCPPNFKPSKGVAHDMPPRETKRANAAKKAAQRHKNLAERAAANRGDNRSSKKG